MKPIWTFIIVGTFVAALMAMELLPKPIGSSWTDGSLGAVVPLPAASTLTTIPGVPGVNGKGSGRTWPKRSFRDPALADVLDYIWGMESTKGLDPRWRIEGPASERGEYRLTKIFIEDVKRICGFVIDPFDIDKCRYGIFMWLKHYAPRVGAVTAEDMWQLFNLGPTGCAERTGL